MITDTHLNFYSVFTFLGVFQGLILSYYFFKKGSAKNIANIYQGFLLLTLSLSIFEEFLNETGYIVQVLPISNFAEPFNFLFAPLFYLFIKRSLKPEFSKKDLLHFLVFLFWAGYMIFYFTQSNEFKYNSYLGSKHPDWPYLDVIRRFDDDPLGIRRYTNDITPVYFVVYMLLAIRLLVVEVRKSGLSLFRATDAKIKNLRNITIHFIVIIVIFIVVKLSFQSDIGDYFISSYVSFMFISTTLRILNRSTFHEETTTFMDFPLMKYKKSTLTDEAKLALLKKIEHEMAGNKYFMNHMASLGELSRTLRESTHHVSQVINEKLQMNFFELLASYRIEEAKKILYGDKEKKITIEDLADQVGYNSKSAFNNAFKKLTARTPSEFREDV